jgi:hypothetical protein
VFSTIPFFHVERIKKLLCSSFTYIPFYSSLKEKRKLTTNNQPAVSPYPTRYRRQNIDLDNSITDRGSKLLEYMYRDNLEPILAAWGSMRADFEWLQRAIIYGTFLADNDVLSPVEGEMVVLTAIMCQGLVGPTIWHLRGLRRLGCTTDEVESTQQAVEAVATWVGRSTAGWPRVTDIKDEI